MKIKQAPGDFVVEEALARDPLPDGPFALFRLEKSGLGTREAVGILARAWRLAPDRISFAGLKDRHGDTLQWIAVPRGRGRALEQRRLRVEPAGFTDRPLTRSDVGGNRFRVRVRDLSEAEGRRLVSRGAEIERHGFANYYDDQRFGSMRATPGRLVAGEWLRGDFEAALRLAIAAPSPQDPTRLRRRRSLLAERWGRWPEILERIEPSPERSVVKALAAGATAREAYLRLDDGLRSLHFSAWQAWVFNACLRRAVGTGPRAEGVGQEYLFYEGDPGPLAELRIPLASPRVEADPLLDAVLADERVTREAMAGTPLRRGLRAAVAHPERFEVAGPRRDDLQRGRWLVELSFGLGRGAYATMLLKRLTYEFPRRRRS
jgi:tRNA pseudouridine13 synthase